MPVRVVHALGLELSLAGATRQFYEVLNILRDGLDGLTKWHEQFVEVIVPEIRCAQFRYARSIDPITLWRAWPAGDGLPVSISFCQEASTSRCLIVRQAGIDCPQRPKGMLIVDWETSVSEVLGKRVEHNVAGCREARRVAVVRRE